MNETEFYIRLLDYLEESIRNFSYDTTSWYSNGYCMEGGFSSYKEIAESVSNYLKIKKEWE